MSIQKLLLLLILSEQMFAYHRRLYASSCLVLPHMSLRMFMHEILLEEGAAGVPETHPPLRAGSALECGDYEAVQKSGLSG